MVGVNKRMVERFQGWCERVYDLSMAKGTRELSTEMQLRLAKRGFGLTMLAMVLLGGVAVVALFIEAVRSIGG